MFLTKQQYEHITLIDYADGCGGKMIGRLKNGSQALTANASIALLDVVRKVFACREQNRIARSIELRISVQMVVDYVYVLASTDVASLDPDRGSGWAMFRCR
jgi:hypothetical protein